MIHHTTAMAEYGGHHRHQGSLEGVIDFSTERWDPDERAPAELNFNRIINHYEPLQANDGPYKRVTLVRLTYEHARSQESKNTFLISFFQNIAMSSREDFDALDMARKC
jgi:hypothetical protein